MQDIDRLMEIYREARAIQIRSGNLHQWVKGFPPEELIREDIEKEISHVIVENETVVGAFAFIPGEDPTYNYIEGGAWLDDTRPYATIHRLAGSPEAKGIAKTCFDWCWNQVHNLRIDTHEDNAIMRHCLSKAGFKYCGVIYLASGAPRLAFQKI